MKITFKKCLQMLIQYYIICTFSNVFNDLEIFLFILKNAFSCGFKNSTPSKIGMTKIQFCFRDEMNVETIQPTTEGQGRRTKKQCFLVVTTKVRVPPPDLCGSYYFRSIFLLMQISGSLPICSGGFTPLVVRPLKNCVCLCHPLNK